MKAPAREWLAAVAMVFIFVSVGAAQQMQRLIDWPPVMVGPSANTPALELVKVRVNETQIILGKSFSADEDWLDKLTFRVRNISDKTVTAFWFNVAFPEIDPGHGGHPTAIQYDARKSSDPGKRIPPGGEVEVTLAREKLANIRETNMKTMGTTHLTMLNVLPGVVFFDDGSSQVIWLGRPRP
jgi:hypothetical protein